jgi:PDZ domain
MGRGLASSTWPSMLVAGWLLLGTAPAPCAAQPAPSAVPSGGGITPGAMPPPPRPYSGMGGISGAGGAQPPAGGVPATGGSPATTGAQPAIGYPTTLGAQPGLGGMEENPSAAGSAGNQPPPIPLPPPHDLGTQVVGPMPLAALTPLPSLSLDHYGDGSGTVGAGLIWMGQLPHQYHGSRYHDGDGKVGGPIPHLARITPHSSTVTTNAPLGYGPPGDHPGFYGFGLSFHPGYGYGGNALGVGALGGYPCYGGPGYPLHYGYPQFTANPYYEGIGQLYYDQPVVITELTDAGDFGPYTGASEYAYTHPSYAAEAAATGSAIPGMASSLDTSVTTPTPEATYTPSGAGAMSPVPAQGRFLGMELQPGVAGDGRKGLTIASVLPGSTAANAGLQSGDLILSVNGQATPRREDLNRIVAGAPADTLLNMAVLKASTGREQAVTARIP